MVRPAPHVAILIAAGVLLSAWLAPSPGAAQDRQAEARQLFEQGVRAMDAGQTEQASRYFQQSYQLYPRASTACNMALMLERTGQACDAQSWYRQCAALDTEGRFRDHANRQAAALASQCSQPAGAFVGDSAPVGPTPINGGRVGGSSTGGGLPIVEMNQGGVQPTAGPDHSLLGVGIASLVLGVGGLVGGALSAQEATLQADMLPQGAGAVTPLAAGSAEAAIYDRATTFSNVAIGLYAGAGVLGGLGLILIIVDLAQPGAFGGSARTTGGPTLTLSPTDGGAFAQVRARF